MEPRQEQPDPRSRERALRDEDPQRHPSRDAIRLAMSALGQSGLMRWCNTAITK
jgi:hypothetical protein